MKSNIHATNTPVRIGVPEGQNAISTAETFSQHLKCDKPLGAKDKVSSKRKAPNTFVEVLQTRQENVLLPDHYSHIEPLEEVSPMNTEISINYVRTGEVLDINQIIVCNIFAYKITLFVTSSDDEIETQVVVDCRRQNDWLM